MFGWPLTAAVHASIFLKCCRQPCLLCRRRDIHKIDRPPLHLAMYERIVTGGHRTADGDNADFYFVPITSRYRGQATGLGWQMERWQEGISDICDSTCCFALGKC